MTIRNSIVISSGHGRFIRGAAGSPVPPYLDEVDEARRTVDRVAKLMLDGGLTVKVFHDNVSTSQNANLNAIVNYHNAQTRELDVSVHFNANVTTSNPMGTECLYVTQQTLSTEIATAIATAGSLKNRGAKKRTDLFFLNKTAMPAVLIEVCFVDSLADADLYNANFERICGGIANTLAGRSLVPGPVPPDPGALFTTTGRTSWFGGPDDTGVSPSEGLAFISEVSQAPQLFLPSQPPGTTGLARRLNPHVHYVACRWDYSVTPKTMLQDGVAWVQSTKTGYGMKAFPADWGPNESTGRTSDLSPSLLENLKLTTDDEVTVTFPAPS